MAIYLASIEYKYVVELDNLEGGFVYAFVKASDSKSALENIFQKLKEENATSIKVEFIKEYDPKTEWGNSNQTKHYNELYLSALNSLNVVLDDFYAYERRK